MLGVDALQLALGGGEDYELLATLRRGRRRARARAELDERFGVSLTEVGVIIEGHGLVGVDGSGRTSPLAPAGWDHFADAR